MNKHPELITIRDFIRYATTSFNQAGLFFGHGTDNAWDEAVALVLHTLSLPHNINSAILDAHLVADEKQKLLKQIETRVNKRIPLAYLTNEAWFQNLSFYVDERVIIPRSSIAELIEKHFEPWVEPVSVNNILDLCTGSGCIAIACAFAFQNAHVDASDVSDDALAVAKINVLRHDVMDRVTLYQSDLFEAIPQKKYDIIVSNPPYVSETEIQSLPAEYLHEPKLSLAAGENGLDLIIKILQNASNFLNDKGILVIEVGNSEEALAQHYPNIPLTWLEFEHSDGGVLLITKEELVGYATQL